MDDYNYDKDVDQGHMTKKYLLDQSYALTGNMDKEEIAKSDVKEINIKRSINNFFIIYSPQST